jgi:hypothetical protein
MTHWNRKSKERKMKTNKSRYSVQMLDLDNNLLRDFDNVEQAAEILGMSSRHIATLAASEQVRPERKYWLRYGKKCCKGEHILQESEVEKFYSLYNKKGTVNCLMCARDFLSPNITTIRICDGCKTSCDYYNQADCRTGSYRSMRGLNHYPTA